MNLIREVLICLEEGKDVDEVSGYELGEVKYHKALCIEAGLADGISTTCLDNVTNAPDAVFLKKLTWDGHEFLDSVRQESVWNTIKAEFKESSIDTIINVSKQLAEGFAKKKVEQLLDETD